MEDLYKSFAEELEERKLTKATSKMTPQERNAMIDNHMDDHMNSSMDGGPSDDPAHAARQKKWNLEYNTHRKKLSSLSDQDLQTYDPRTSKLK